MSLSEDRRRKPMSARLLQELQRVRSGRLLGQSRAQVATYTGIPERRIKHLESRFGSAVDGVPIRELTPRVCAEVRRAYAIGLVPRSDWAALAALHGLTLDQALAIMNRRPGTPGSAPEDTDFDF